MRFIPHTPDEIRQMLAVIGADELERLFDPVPAPARLGRPLELPRPLSEQEVLASLRELASRNATSGSHTCFVGAGAYAHFVPAVVASIASRAEFLTSYTPYQPEISQGTLQTIFEWQTMICALTGLEVSNASLYDGASATAEAVLMAMRCTRRHRVLLAGGLHPHWRDVVRTYLQGLDAELVELATGPDGRSEAIASHLDDDVACVVVQQPAFLGPVQDLAPMAEAAHAHGALLVVAVAEALSLALLRPPGELGADIACGEAQSFGIPLSFGGPYLGFLAARSRFVRQLPGRLVGETVDARGRRGFVLTLSTREQHIRRERATSNICTNQGLCLLMATVYLALLGPRGLRALARDNLARAHYARERIAATAGVELLHPGPVFNEFAVRTDRPPAEILEEGSRAGLLAGLDLEPHAPELGPALLLCTTELARRSDIDRLVALLGKDRP